MATTLAGRQPFSHQINRGVQFITDTYTSSQGTSVPGDQSMLLSRGIVIEGNFNRDVYGVGGVMRPPYSLNIKIIGDDFNTDDPTDPREVRWYAPFFPIHNIIIPEVGEEVLLINESQDYSSKGYWIGRVNESALTNLFLAESWKTNSNIPSEETYSSPEERYGFSFDVEALRKNNKISIISPSPQFENIAIDATYGDVIQQGRSRTYIRHSFNRNNYVGILEQGLNNDLNTTSDNLGFQPVNGVNPSIGDTRTKTIHLYDASVKRLGDFNFVSEKREADSGNLEGANRAMIVNEADQIFNIAGGSNGFNTSLYSQVLGEKLNDWQRANVNIVQSMLDGLTGLTTTVQTLLNAFIDHEHALPKIELNLEKSITSRDRYRTSSRVIPQPDQVIEVPGQSFQVPTGETELIRREGLNKDITDQMAINSGMAFERPVTKTTTTPASTITVKSAPKVIPGRMRTRTIRQKINFEAIIGGEEDPRFTAPIELSKTPESPMIPAWASQQERMMMMRAQGASNPEFTDLGIKTNKVNNNTEDLIDAFNEQKEQLNMIFNRVTEYLSENQFVN